MECIGQNLRRGRSLHNLMGDYKEVDDKGILFLGRHDVSRTGILVPNYKVQKFGNLYCTVRGLSHSRSAR